MELIVIDEVYAWQLSEGDIITLNGYTDEINTPADYGDVIGITFKGEWAGDEEIMVPSDILLQLLGY